MQRTLLVTGASSGIGRATALLAGSHGYRVAVHYRAREQAARELVAELAALGAEAVPVRAALDSEAGVVSLYEAVDRALGPLHAVVNSAGIAIPSCPVAELDAVSVSELLAINVLGVLLSCREAVRRMARSRGGEGGVIVNVSSMAATIGGRPGSAAYAASKAAVDVFTEGLAKEIAAEGIRAVAVRPGMVDTEMTRAALSSATFRETVRRSIPLGRPAHPEEVARPIVWLLSEEASFVSGACIDVSGGGFHVASAADSGPRDG